MADSEVGKSGRWLQRISTVQLERMTPDAREELRARAEKQRRVESARRSCRSMSGHSTLSRDLMHEGLRQMTTSSTPAEFTAASARWRSAQLCSRTMTQRSIDFAESMQADETYEATIWRDEEVEAERFAETSRLVASTTASESVASAATLDGAGAPVPSSLGGQSSVADPLLDQLRTEPTNDEEAQAKFAMYETYSEEVGKMHETLFSFHAQHRESLPSAVEREIDRQLSTVDSTEALGIPDDTRYWFVFYMMKQASKNNSKMEAVLKDYERKLELLAKNAQEQCPICLGNFGSEKPAQTLGCCHAVCIDCWEHWTAIRYGRPFCPLCRHDEFLQTVATAVGALSTSPGPIQSRGSLEQLPPIAPAPPTLAQAPESLTRNLCERVVRTCQRILQRLGSAQLFSRCAVRNR